MSDLSYLDAAETVIIETFIQHKLLVRMLFAVCQFGFWFCLWFCSSLAALPESIGQLRVLTGLDLGGCSSLAALPFNLLRAAHNDHKDNDE